MKRASLSHALREAAGHPKVEPPPKLRASVDLPPATASQTKRAPSRVGKVVITAFVEPEVSIQLKIVAAKKRTSIQKLLVQALNHIFQENGMPEIAA